MQIVRTIVWVLLLVGLLVFSAANWEPTVTVQIWMDLVVDTKIPAIVLVAFLIGFVPIWLLYRTAKWRHKRRIQSLESAARMAASTPVARPSMEDANADAGAEGEDTATALRPEKQ